MEHLNMLGQPCPIPVVQAKRALAKPNAKGVTVRVDTLVAVQNLEKMAGGFGYHIAYTEQANDDYTVTITAGEGSVPPTTRTPAASAASTPAASAASSPAASATSTLAASAASSPAASAASSPAASAASTLAASAASSPAASAASTSAACAASSPAASAASSPAASAASSPAASAASTPAASAASTPAASAASSPAACAACTPAASAASTSVKNHGDAATVLIGSDTMGSGAEELGRILIKGFIFSLGELSTPPHSVIFVNSGVMLTTKDANTVADLELLASKGTHIYTCGTCANFYHLSQNLAVGELTDMMSITTLLANADRLITL